MVGDTARAVAAIGECMVELVAAGDDLWRLGWGGDTLNLAVYLARLGEPVHYLTALGDDRFSERMLAGWRAEGVGTDRVARLPGRMPGLYAIETDAAGERSFHYWRSEAAARDVMKTLDPQTALAGVGLLVLSGITLAVVRGQDRPALFALLDAARARGTGVAFDLNVRPRMWPDPAAAAEVFGEALSRADLAFATLDDLAGLALADDIASARAAIRDRFAGEAVLRIAPDRAAVAPAGAAFEAVDLPAPVAAADTTGAGDSFAAGYVAARRRGLEPARAVRAADRVARVVVRHAGAIAPRDAADWPALVASDGGARASEEETR